MPAIEITSGTSSVRELPKSWETCQHSTALSTAKLASDEEPYRGTDSTGPVIGGLYADEVVGFVLAACGLRFQLSRSFGLPLLLRLVLLPALALEGVLALLFLGLGP